MVYKFIIATSLLAISGFAEEVAQKTETETKYYNPSGTYEKKVETKNEPGESEKKVKEKNTKAGTEKKTKTKKKKTDGTETKKKVKTKKSPKGYTPEGFYPGPQQ